MSLHPPFPAALGSIASCWLAIAIPLNAGEYTGDGELTGREEQLRWMVNRARFDPLRENKRWGTSYLVPESRLQPLAPCGRMIQACRRHAADLSQSIIFDHPSPSSSPYYPAGSSPAERARLEGYVAEVYKENIAAGHRDAITTHQDWWNSSSHRPNLMQAAWLEIGVGYVELGTSLYGTYTVQDFGVERNTGEHFFTDTLFHDADGDSSYGEMEGVGKVAILLEFQGRFLDAYDVSTASGGFAIPIGAIPDREWVSVFLTNPDTNTVRIHLPLKYDHLREITLRPSETILCGTFQQPTNRSNLGWRDLTLAADAPQTKFLNSRLQIDASGGQTELYVRAVAGDLYLLLHSEDLRTWIYRGIHQATVPLLHFTDKLPPSVACRFYGIVEIP